MAASWSPRGAPVGVGVEPPAGAALAGMPASALRTPEVPGTGELVRPESGALAAETTVRAAAPGTYTQRMVPEWVQGPRKVLGALQTWRYIRPTKERRAGVALALQPAVGQRGESPPARPVALDAGTAW